MARLSSCPCTRSARLCHPLFMLWVWSTSVCPLNIEATGSHRESMMALLTGSRPPQLAQPHSKSQKAPPALLSGQPSSSSCPSGAGNEASGHVDKSRKTSQPGVKLYKLQPTAPRLPIRDHLPASRTACQHGGGSHAVQSQAIRFPAVVHVSRMSLAPIFGSKN